MLAVEPTHSRVSNTPSKTEEQIDLVYDLVHTGGMEVNIHDAKTHLSRLLERVSLGEEVVIARAGKPIARLVRIEPAKQNRVLGRGEGDFEVPDDFNAPLPEEVLKEFYK